VQFARTRLPTSSTPVSVEDALRLALPAGTRVLQRDYDAQRTITWARAFVNRPWAISTLEEGAMVVLSLRGLSRSELQTLPRLVDALLTANVSSIVLTDESAAIVEAIGRDPTLPVFVLPPDAPPADVERAVIGLLIDRDGQVKRRAAEVYQQLIQLAIQGAPMLSIAQSLAEAAGRVVYLEDEYGVLQAVATPSEYQSLSLPSTEDAPSLYSAQDVLGISTTAPASSGIGGCIRRVLETGHAVFSAPITLGTTVAGFLTLLGHEREMQDLDEQIVTGAASAFAFPIATQRAIIETQLRLQGSFLESLFSGTLSDESDIAERARYFGHNLREPYDAVCITLDGHLDGHGGIGEAQRLGVWSSFVDVARRELLERWPRALLRERGDLLAILLPAQPGPPHAQLRTQLEEARVRLGRLVGGTAATIGVGTRAAGPAAIVRSYGEAEQAARIGRQFLGGNRTVSFEDLGVYRVIARVEDRSTLESFRQEYLGNIEEYDVRHGTELAETLEGFFACNGNHARAAEELHLHRNTLLYRLDRIEALSGRDLSDPEVRLALQLALKIRRVFPTIR